MTRYACGDASCPLDDPHKHNAVPGGLAAVRSALTKMAYREAKPGRWAKPIGFQLFTYDEAANRWTNWFRDAQGQISVWDAHAIEGTETTHGTPLFQIKGFECWTRTDMAVDYKSEFELSDDLAALL